MTTRTDSSGFSFVELLAAISIVGVALLVMVQQLSISIRETDLGRDEIFAYQKALGMLSELQSSVERGTITDANSLDGYDDQGTTNIVLTTLTATAGPVAPDHPTSGNHLDSELGWVWGRTITVEAIPANERLRYVRIGVSKIDRAGVFRRLATVGGVLSLTNDPAPSVKRYDVYVLALAELGSTWRTTADALSAIDSAVDRIRAENPSIDFDVHWINQLGYGRDATYVPYLNQATVASTAAPFTYWYPGVMSRMPLAHLFQPDLFDARVSKDGVVQNDYDSATNPLPFAVADSFNHCVRTPEAQALFDARVALGLDDEMEPPLQVLLASMAADPERYANAIVLNLHGDALPFPPLRNYADAAKDPASQPGVRVVTHPTRLQTPRDPDGDGSHGDTDDVEFRVYAYKTDPDVGPTITAEAITLQFWGVNLAANVNGVAGGGTPTTLEIRRLVGGIDPETGWAAGDEDDREYDDFDSSDGDPPLLGSESDPYEMAYEVGYEAGPPSYTWIKLHNTPVVSPEVDDRGLHVSQRLYGMEYIPSPVDDDGDFDDLDKSTGGSGKPKNTARWRIRVPKAVFESSFPGGAWIDQDHVLQVTTRLGEDFDTGRSWPTPNEPANQSTTWAWWASSAEAVPITERFQIFGDPRHCPYADFAEDSGSPLEHGYNWFFDDLVDAANPDALDDWDCIDDSRLASGFGDATVAFDVPRVFEIYRRAFGASRSTFVNTGGRLGGAVLTGGELFAPRVTGSIEHTAVYLAGALLARSGMVSVDQLTVPVPLAMAAAPMTEVAVATPSTLLQGDHVVVSGDSSSPFWAKPWLGELAPDSAWSSWLATGNLPTGVGPGLFHRELRHEATLSNLPAGTDFAQPSGRVLTSMGPPSLLQIGSSTGFGITVGSASATGSLETEPAEMVDKLLGASAAGGAARFQFSPTHTVDPVPPHLLGAGASDYPHHYLLDLEPLVTIGDDDGASVLRLLAPVAAQGASFWVPMPFVPVTQSEHDDLAALTLAFGLRAFHVSGEPAFANDVEQVPSVRLTRPTANESFDDPTAVLLKWRANFLRFDTNPYTAGYLSGYTGAEDQLAYALLVSSDDGATWHYLKTGGVAVPGERPPVDAFQLDAGIGDESFLWETPAASVAAGTYIVRIGCWHRTRLHHRSTHEVTIRVRR